MARREQGRVKEHLGSGELWSATATEASTAFEKNQHKNIPLRRYTHVPVNM